MQHPFGTGCSVNSGTAVSAPSAATGPACSWRPIPGSAIWYRCAKS